MIKDLTTSRIDRQNILNNEMAIEEIQDKSGITGIEWDGKIYLTREAVASFFNVDIRTISRYIEQYNDELKENGYIVLRDQKLKSFLEIMPKDFAKDINVPSKIRQLGLFDFRAFLNMAMLLSESEKARALRQLMLDIVIDLINRRTGGGTKYINQRDKDYIGSALQEENYRRQFTDALKLYVAEDRYKYAHFTDMIYVSIFKEKAHEYKKILDLKASDKVRDTFYSEILDIMDERSLLIIVDTHSPNFLESKAVYEHSERVVVIDHHRMMVNHIDNAVVFYHEPYASSACEMTAELIQYLSSEPPSRLESEAMLSGIMLDTKNFVLRTGVRTFEAAAYLRKNGADTVEVKRLFSNSIDTYKVKYKLVSDAEIFNYCAIACADEATPDIRIASAQAADELLGIENVKASFVMYKTGKTVNISARSLGDLNVQVIMESLGGGGHQTMAACQMEDVSIAEARERLVSIINDLDLNKTNTANN